MTEKTIHEVLTKMIFQIMKFWYSSGRFFSFVL